jgi:hypothetical protein
MDLLKQHLQSVTQQLDAKTGRKRTVDTATGNETGSSSSSRGGGKKKKVAKSAGAIDASVRKGLRTNHLIVAKKEVEKDARRREDTLKVLQATAPVKKNKRQMKRVMQAIAGPTKSGGRSKR